MWMRNGFDLGVTEVSIKSDCTGSSLIYWPLNKEKHECAKEGSE